MEGIEPTMRHCESDLCTQGHEAEKNGFHGCKVNVRLAVEAKRVSRTYMLEAKSEGLVYRPAV